MAEEKVKFAIIGCGNIGTRHCAAINNESRATLSAVCDIDETKCKDFSMKNGNIPYFTDYKKMLREINVDVVDICTPNNLHSIMAIESMRMKRNVLLEKPMALKASEATKMIKIASKNKVKLMIVKQNRFNIPVTLVQKAISEGKLGKIFMINANVLWNRNTDYYSKSNWHGKKKMEGGALYTQASHFIDLLILWCGKVTKVKAFIDTKNHSIEIEDCGSALLKFKNGAMGILEWTTCVYNKNYEGSITIIGENGTIKIGGSYLNKIEFWDVKSYPLSDNTPTEENNIYERGKTTISNHQKVISNTVSAILNEKCEIVSGKEGYDTVEAIEKIYKSARMNR